MVDICPAALQSIYEAACCLKKSVQVGTLFLSYTFQAECPSPYKTLSVCLWSVDFQMRSNLNNLKNDGWTLWQTLRQLAILTYFDLILTNFTQISLYGLIWTLWDLFGAIFQNRKQNYLNRKWNYFTYFQASD